MNKTSKVVMSLVLQCLSVMTFGSNVEFLKGRGIWVNNPSNFNERKTNLLKEIGVRRVHFMLTDDIKKIENCSLVQNPKEVVNKENLLSAIRVAKTAGLKVVLTSYVPPARGVIDSMLANDSMIAQAVNEGGLDGIEYDLEGRWVTSLPCEFASHVEAVSYLISKTKSLQSEIPVGVTVHYGRLNSPKINVNAFDWIAAQAYSKCPLIECAENVGAISREGKSQKQYDEEVAWAWGNPNNQPGVMQKKIPARLGEVTPFVIIGLPAYSQYWNSNHTVAESMLLAHNATNQLKAEHENYIGENYWGLSNILSSKSNPEIVKFLKSTVE